MKLLMEVSRRAGLTFVPTQFARVHVNGGFLRYMMVFYRSFLETSMDEWEKKCWHQSSELKPDLFKAQGSPNEGPYGLGDFRELNSRCDGRCTRNADQCPSGRWTELNRYEYTYNRQSNSAFGSHEALKEFIEANDDLPSCMPRNRPNLTYPPAKSTRRAILSSYLDVNLMLNYIVTLNYAGTWDQNFHNQFLIHRIGGKWSWHPWDADRLYGEQLPYNADLYAGDTSELHYLKRNVIRAFRDELDERFVGPSCG